MSTETKPYMVTLTGPSGSGKTTILNALLKSGKFTPLISTTTRPPRAGEVDGKDYKFTDKTSFEMDLRRGSFAQHVEFRGCYYGTHVDDIKQAFETGLIPVCIVEPGGITQFSIIGTRFNFEVESVFIHAKVETLIERYLKRVIEEVVVSVDDKVGDNLFINVRYHSKRLAKIVEEAEEWGNSEIDTHIYSLRYYNEDSPHLRSIPQLVDALTTRQFDVYDFVSHKNDPTKLNSDVSKS